MDSNKLHKSPLVQRAKWGSSAKFNKILSNLERSIMAQFSSGQTSSNNNESSNHKTNSASKTVAKKVQKQTTNPVVVSSSSSNTSNVQATISQLNKRYTEQQQQQAKKESNQISINNKERIALQQAPKSETSRVKGTLNKYQQQIVSTMRPKQLATNNNRLSIPPPHANDEARNQNHRLLFGNGCETRNTNQESSDTLKCATLGLPHRQTVGKEDIKLELNSINSNSCRLKSSPAISSESLPNLSAKSRSHSNQQVAKNQDEEESGFSTYRSCRSLLTSANNNTSNSDTTTTTIEPNTNSNMIVLRQNRPILGPVNFESYKNNISPSQQQQFVYSYQQHPLVSYVPQNMSNAQRYLPTTQIQTNAPISLNGNNCYSSNQMQMQMNNWQHRQFQNQQLLNDCRNQQVYGLSRPNTTLAQAISVVDNGQQIYANAPPKPRRYQYYDTVNPTLFTQSMSSQPSVSHSTGGSIPPQSFNRIETSQVHRQPLDSDHQVYNISYPSSYHQQDPRMQNIYMQQESSFNISQPQQLTKSKSSLDAGDLLRFKQERFHTTNPTQSNVLHQQSRQQQQQLLYNTRFDDRYTNSIQSQQQRQSSLPFVQTNLQRSKSVTHLLPEYDNQQSNNQMQDQSMDNSSMFHDTRLVSCSSASTTNLNTLVNSQQFPQQQQFVKYPSRSNVSQQAFNDSIQQQNNHQLFRNTVRQRQQPQRSNNLTSYKGTLKDFGNNQNYRIDSNSSGANLTLLNNGKIVRQSQNDNSALEVGFDRPSLDDKIRHLLIGNDTNEASTLKRSNQNNNGVTYPQARTCNNGSSSQAKFINHNQSGESQILSHNDDSIAAKHQEDHQNVNNAQAESQKWNHNKFASEAEMTNRLYIDKASSTMGNRQQHQYRVNGGNKRGEDLTSSLKSNDIGRSNTSNSINSHLIVDLTTPRVLAKTQTTLLSSDTTNEIQQQQRPKEYWSMNQVGLPQVQVKSLNNSVVAEEKQHQPTPNEHGFSSSFNSNKLHDTNQYDNDTKRTAPYYYSDLKSDEQRQALLSIVQQKSLSPPPQLLSRSTDQSNTRLTTKSATMHPGHARLLSESLSQKRSSNPGQGLLKSALANGGSNSTSTIAKNIDKLFSSPTQPDITNNSVVQSMLALDANSIDSSPSQSAKESLLRNYLKAGDMRECGNFSKSKSLENIGLSFGESKTFNNNNNNKFVNPVYENMRQSDKLMNAIKSTSTDDKNASSKNENYSEESLDSILGSSLDESDSSLDIIDEVKISPSDNHLSDLSHLIEQLKINHSKLTQKYQSTLIRISKTIDSKKKQVNDNYKSEKLDRKVQLLELKSKKCESRSKNQLALIQMMEKVLQQSRTRGLSGSLVEREFNAPSQKKNLSTTNSSNSNSKDNHQASQLIKDSRPTQGIIKALVTEAKDQNDLQKPEQVNLQTYTDVQSSGRVSIGNQIAKSSSGKVETIVTTSKRKDSNPFNQSSTDDDESNSSSASSLNNDLNNCSMNLTSKSSNSNQLSNSNSLEMLRDDDDFIEFLSNDGMSHRSQFEASQFSVSEFNTSASTSESSTSGNGHDSLNSPVMSNSSARQLFNVGSGGSTNTGILKNCKSGNYNNNKSNSSIVTETHKDNGNKTKFNDVLGNVIDVDICPINNLAPCSPVNNGI